MADISKITLPNGDSYDIKDNGAVRINDGTLTGTTTAESLLSDEVVAGSLIVNGDSRFVNPINGDLVGDVTGNVVGNVSGSAGTAGAFTSAKSVTLTGDVTGSASSTGGWSVATTVKDDSHNHTTTTIVPKITKSYTGLIGTENNASNGSFYFIKVVPDTFNGNWYIDYKLTCTMNGVSDANGGGRQNCHVKIYGMRNTYSGYDIWNSISNTSYRSIYYHNIYRAKSAGISYGHAIGVGFRNAYGPTNSTYSRNITVEILDYQGCTVSLLDTAVKYANWTGTGSTNYDGLSELDAYTNGRRMTGDNNDTTTLQYSTSRLTAGTNGLPGYSIVMMKPNGTWEGLTVGNATTATTSTKNTSGFVLGQMYWYQSGTNIASGSITGTSTIRTAQDWVDFRYTSNCGSTLTNNKMIYIKGTITNGLFYLADTWWTQDLPTTADGFVYIPVGICYGSGYAFCFWGWHGAYYHNGTTVVEYKVPTIPDWDENNSSSPNYIENRTHYRTNLGYNKPVHVTLEADDADSHTIVINGVSYDYGLYMDCLIVDDLTDVIVNTNASSTTALVTTNNTTTTYNLSVYTQEDDGIPYNLLLYNNDICIRLGITTDLTVNNGVTIYTDDYLANFSNFIINIPTTNEQFEYTKKLDSGYLNGKLITSGTGKNSEIFNDKQRNIASGEYSHAEGFRTTASNASAHAEGEFSTASGYASHAEGNSTTSGTYSHAEGYYTTASGSVSHTEGYYTIASGDNSHAEGYRTISSGESSHAEGNGYANGIGSHAEGSGYTNGRYSHAEGGGDCSSIPAGSRKIYLTGVANTTSYTVNSYTLDGNRQSLIGFRLYNSTITIIGETVTNGVITGIEVNKPLVQYAINNKLFNFVGGSAATGDNAHSEGEYTLASGNDSHAEGFLTTASGNYSHAEGYETTAQRKSQHVFGEFNVLDTGGTNNTTRGTYVEIVGKGTGNNARSNARTLDWSGNEVLAGKLTVGAAPTNNMDVATKQYVDNAVAPEVLVVTFTYSSGNDFTADKSYSDITTAYNAGKIVYGKTPEFSCIYNSGYFRSIGAETDEIGYRIFYYMSYVSGNTWTRGYLDATSPYLDLSGNRLQLKQGSATISYVDLPVYNGGVS